MILRDQLVETALLWQKRFSVAPRITDAVAEYDAAMLLGMAEEEYSAAMKGRTAVSRGHDFVFRGLRYQVKANRPSGNKGSPVTKVAKANNYKWDVLIWIHYNKEFVIQEVWEWSVADYRAQFHDEKYTRPVHMRRGRKLY